MINYKTRNKGVGGSELAAVLGLSPYETPYDVWLRKTGQSDPIEDNQYMKRGRILEPIIADGLVDLLKDEFCASDIEILTVDEFYTNYPDYANIVIDGIRSYDNGVGTDTIFSKDYDFCFSSPDRFIMRNGLLYGGAELKSINDRSIKTAEDVAEKCLSWVFQSQYCMQITGLKRWCIGWVCDFDLSVHHIWIDYDPTIAEMVFNEVGLFWEYVKSNTPPPPINAEDVIRMYPNPSGTIEAVDELYSVIQDYAAAKHGRAIYGDV